MWAILVMPVVVERMCASGIEHVGNLVVWTAEQVAGLGISNIVPFFLIINSGNDEAMFKLSCQALKNIAKKWTMPARGWKSAPNQLSIIFEDRIPNF